MAAPRVNVLGMSAISGPSASWLIELHDSFASLEAVDKILSADPPPRPPVDSPRQDTLIALYRPGLSYRPDQAVQLFPRMRYLEVMVSRIKPGTEADFAKLIRLRDYSLDSVNADRPEIAFQVISGAPAGTWIFLSPMQSLRALDDGRAQTPVSAEGAEAAARKIAADTELTRERLWFRLEPRASYVSDSFASADSTFWRSAQK